MESLILEVRNKGFKFSKELSNYIINNQLQEKYPNISGIVKMKKDSKEWDFYGGFSKKIYRILCDNLDLSDQETKAKAISFKPFKGMKDHVNKANI